MRYMRLDSEIQIRPTELAGADFIGSDTAQTVDMFERPEFFSLSPHAQRRAREARELGIILDPELLLDEQLMEKYADNVDVGIHEGGHSNEVIRQGFSLRKAKVFLSGAIRGVTEYSINWMSGVKSTLRKLMRVGMAGGKAAEADGLTAHGCGSDHAKVRGYASFLKRYFGESESAEISDAANDAYQNARSERKSLVIFGHRLAAEAMSLR